MISIAIQAGGRSNRMGRDKGLVPLAGKPLVEHVLEQVADLGEDILITTNHPEGYAYPGVRTVPDAEPGAGALPGLLTALEAARGEYVLVVACDMPFLNRAFLEFLIMLAPQADVVVPLWGGIHQTMHAVYARQACLPPIRRALTGNRRRMISFYDAVRVMALPETETARFDARGLTYFNVNTPEELAEAERLVACGTDKRESWSGEFSSRSWSEG